MKSTGNDDLTDLLNEAKHTILELQHEIESLKSEIDQLRQQNRSLAAQNDTPHNQTNLKTINENRPASASGGKESKPTPAPAPTPVPTVQGQKDSSAAVSLEPVVIVNDNGIESSANTKRKTIEHPMPRIASKNAQEQMPSDQTSQSDNTFVV